MRKMVAVVLIILFLIVGIFIGAAGMSDFYSSRNMKLGKSFCVTVSSDEVVDAPFLRKVLNGEREDNIDLMEQEVLEALIIFMDRNSFCIMEGDYLLNQTFDFKEVLDELRFDKI